MSSKIDKKITEIVSALKAEFKPSRLFLFGSRSNDTATPDSDYDFVVVVPKNTKSRAENMEKARQLLHKKCKISADVFVYSQEEFADWEDELNSIPETAKNTGREIDLG